MGLGNLGSSLFFRGCLFPVGFTALWGVRAQCSRVGSTDTLLLGPAAQLPSQEYVGEDVTSGREMGFGFSEYNLSSTNHNLGY